MPDQATLEARVARLERLVEQLAAYARTTRAGRLILARLGIDDA